MEIITQSHGFKASDALTTFVKEKLDKVDHLSNSIIRADVTLMLNGDTNNNKACEIRLEIPGNDLFVKKSADSFELATVEAVDALEMQMRKHKEKLRDKRQVG
jgi:putative sigma-54 modulation protein